MATERHCPRCGRALTAGALEDLCPGCVGRELLAAEAELRSQSSEVSDPQPEVTEPSPLASSFGDYELLEEIARGGMGVVYLARQKSLNRLVALKVILGGGHAGPQFIQRFRTEAEATAHLQHPNIVAIHEVGEHEGQHFFSMDYVEGPDLERLTGRRPVPAGKAARYAQAIAEAIQYAHQHGVLHRDVKPSNVLVDSDDQVRITDFGLAKVITSATHLTLSGQVLGSPCFVPPEQASVKRGVVGPASDVYGIGATLYYLLTGRPPFTAEELSDVLQQLLNTDPVSPRLLNPSVPRDLETICLKCLEKDPGRRYPSAQELADDLGRWLRQEPIRALPTSVWGHGVKWVRRKPTIAALVGTVLVVTVLGFATTLWYARDAREKLWQAYLDQARYRRLSGEPGRRFDSLVALGKAAAIRPSLELRNETIACLALPDVRVLKSWRLDPRARDWGGVCFDAQCARYVWACSDGTLRVCNVTDQRELLRLPVPGKPGFAVLRLSPTGQHLAEAYTESDANWLRVWDLARQEIVFNQRMSERGAGLDFSPDSRHLAIGDGAGLVHFHDLGSRRESSILDLHGPHNILRFDPAGKRLAAADGDSTNVAIFDLATGQGGASLGHAAVITDIAWSRDGQRLACASTDQRIHVWNTRTFERQGVLEGHTGGGIGLAFDGRGDVLVSSGWDRVTRFWDPNSGQQWLRVPGRFAPLAFGGNDQALGFVVHNNEAGVWQVDTARECRRLGPAGVLKAAQFNADGTLLATASDDGVRLWRADAGPHLDHWRTGPTESVIFPGGERSVIVSAGSGLLRSPIHVEEPTGEWRFGPAERLHAGPTKSAVLSADGDTLIAACWDDADVLVFDRRRPGEPRRLRGHRGAVSVAISPDGRWFATGTWKGTNVVVWETATGERTRELETGGTTLCLFSPDGQWLLTGSAEDYRLWKVGPWAPGLAFPRDRAGDLPGGMAFSPDSRLLALLIGAGSEVKLVSLPVGREVGTLHTGQPLCFSPDGALLATAGEAGQGLLIWDLALIRRHLAAMKLDWADEGPVR